MSVVVELCGGPLDGQMVDVNALPWSPPLTLRFPEAPPMAAHDNPSLALLEPMTVHAYDRFPSSAETGPVWRYVYRRPE